MKARVVIALVVVAALAAFLVGGGWDFISDGDRVQEFFTERGALGPIVFVLAMWALQPWGVPGAVFMVPASLIWPMPAAIALSWVGNMGASAIAFSFARWVARDWVEPRIPPWMAKYNDRLAQGGLYEVLALRVVTGQLPPADWMLGVSRVRWGPFVVGTAIGIIPGIVLIVWVGGSLFTTLADRPLLLAAIVIGLVMLVRRRRRAL